MHLLAIAALLLATANAGRISGPWWRRPYNFDYSYPDLPNDESDESSEEPEDDEKEVIENNPYQVLIEHENGFICSGVILNENWILTVVTCTPVDAANPMAVVRSGSTQRQQGSTHFIQEIIKHYDFKIVEEGVHHNELALIRVQEPFELDETRKTIELLSPDDKLTPGTKANVSGFGHGGAAWFSSFRKLKRFEASVEDIDKCNESYKSEVGVPEGYICASLDVERVKDKINLEYGDPLVYNGRLAGLVFRLNNYYRRRVKHPVLFTDVTYYQKWINDQINPYDVQAQ